MKEKTYIAKYWRGNPQLKNGGYETTHKFTATNIRTARKLAKEWTEHTVYGSMTLLSVEVAE